MSKERIESIKGFLNKNKIVLGALAVAVVISSSATFATFASENEGGNEDHHKDGVECEYKKGKGGEFKMNHQEMKEAIESGDYDAWAELMGGQEHFDEEKITPETFESLGEIHQLMEDGDKEEARELMKELGLHPGRKGAMHGKYGKFSNKGQGEERSEKMKEHKAEMETIFEAGDYEAWAELMGDSEKFDADLINEDTFNKLSEARDLFEAGDKDGAKEIKKEIFGDDFKSKRNHNRSNKAGRGQ